MGIDFKGSEAHWSYGGFGVFRDRLATCIGINLDHMEGFGGTGSWEAVTDDLVPLLNHSDCDGELTADECRRVAPRLRAIVESWPDEDFPRNYDKTQGLLLAEGMESCAKRRKPLIFR